MLSAARLRRAPSCFALALLAASPLAAGAGTDWGPVTLLDPRPPLELGAPLPGTELPGAVPVAVLFSTVPELVLARVNIAADPPTATFVPIVANGSIFALGPTAQLPSGRIGGSFVDNFDLKFFACDPPCNTVNVFTVDAGPEVWLDSSSAAAAGNFYVSSVDNATGNVQVWRSQDGGVTWTPLRSLAPAGGIYRNFDGGERVSLTVDPNATNPLTALNCLFYELLVNPTTTQKRISCANGDDVIFDQSIGNDVPNAQGNPDKFIENTFRFDLDYFLGLYDRRSDQSVHVLRIDEAGGQDDVVLGTAPVGADFFSYGMTRSGDDRLDVLFPTNTGVEANHQRLDTAGPPPYPTDFELGPTTRQAPFWILWPSNLEDGNGFLYAFFRAFAVPLLGVDGLGVARYPVAIFADGFGSGDSGRWSGTTP